MGFHGLSTSSWMNFARGTLHLPLADLFFPFKWPTFFLRFSEKNTGNELTMGPTPGIYPVFRSSSWSGPMFIALWITGFDPTLGLNLFSPLDANGWFRTLALLVVAEGHFDLDRFHEQCGRRFYLDLLRALRALARLQLLSWDELGGTPGRNKPRTVFQSGNTSSCQDHQTPGMSLRSQVFVKKLPHSLSPFEEQPHRGKVRPATYWSDWSMAINTKIHQESSVSGLATPTPKHAKDLKNELTWSKCMY